MGGRIARLSLKLVAVSAAVLLGLIIILAAFIFCSDKPPLLAEVSFSRLVVDNNGAIIRISLSDDHKYRLRVNLDGIAPEAARAVLHYEDRHFYNHPGINPLSIARAFASRLYGAGRMPGASTITMQVARLRWRLKTTSLAGKLHQAWLALKLERHYSKREILEAYFNLAPYGGNIEGIESAARIYFNKPAARLTTLEAHALAVTPQNPVARNPANGHDFARARARLEDSLDNARYGRELPPLQVRKVENMPVHAPHLALELLGEQHGAQKKITASIELDLQTMLERALKAHVKINARSGIKNAAAMLVECDSMRVAALAGSADFFDSAISGQVDGTRARRSPGSTLKPFIYGLALDQGFIHPHSILPDAPRSFGGYDPENFDRGFRGPIPAHEALKASRNLPAIALSERLANPDLYGLLKDANINLPKPPSHYGLALALGGAEISMRELASLYAMLANQGLWRPLRFSANNFETPPKRILSPEAAWLVMWMLHRGHEEEDTGLIYKTGTSNGFRDAWTAGVVGNYALVVWVGNFDNRANPCFVGAKAALPLYRQIARSLGSLRKLKRFPENPLPGLNLAKTAICVSTGELDKGYCANTSQGWIIPGITQHLDNDILRPVLIDKETGLRACQPERGKTEEIWLEFWPSDMLKIFAEAGINKPQPPDWSPNCGKEVITQNSAKAPAIILPKKNVAYQRKISVPDFQLPLMAAADSEVKMIHWYAGSAYIGKSKPGEIIFWHGPKGGNVEILAVDERGRSAKRKCLIQVLP